MSATIKKKVPKGAMERIDELEKLVPNLITAINEAVSKLDARLNDLSEVVEVIGDKTGREEVVKLLGERREQRDRDNAAKAQEALQKAVEAGVAVAVETVEEKSLLVGVEYDTEGKPVPPARVQLMFNQIKPEVREKLLGKAPGTKVDTPSGGTFEVLEIFNIVDQTTVQATPAATQEPVPEAPPPAPEAVADTNQAGA